MLSRLLMEAFVLEIIIISFLPSDSFVQTLSYELLFFLNHYCLHVCMSVTYTSTCDLLNLLKAIHIFVFRDEHLVLDSQLVISSMGNHFVQSQHSLIPVVLRIGLGFMAFPHPLCHVSYYLCPTQVS